MRSLRGSRAGAIALLAGSILMGGGALAQGAPGCELTPLELPLFGGTPVAVFATPSPSASPAVSAGLSEAEAEDVLQQYVACTNTGDPTLVWAMFTPRWFAQVFADPEQHYLPAFEQMLDSEGQPTGVPLELVDILGIEVHGPKVDVTATFRSGDQAWTDTLTLVQVDGEWRIDDVKPIDPPGDG